MATTEQEELCLQRVCAVETAAGEQPDTSQTCTVVFIISY